MLTPAERETLALVCDAVAGPHSRDDDAHRLWARRASDLGVPGLIEAALPSLPPEQLQEFRRLLRLLDDRAAMLLLARRPRRVREMRRDEIERLLAGWAVSRSARLRQAARALQMPVTYLFYAAHARGLPNPNWAAFGYPGDATAAETPRLAPIEIERDTDLSADAVVVGSGAGGSVVAAELAAAGWDVLVLERGPHLTDGRGSEYEAMRQAYAGMGLLATEDQAFGLLAGACLGGGTVVNWTSALRAPPDTLDRWSRQHRLDAGALPYEPVETRLGVSTAWSHHNPANQALADGCRHLGYRVETIPRNVAGCDERACGWCPYGCVHGMKRSALATYLEDAAARGARIVVRCRVTRVLTDRGSVRGVEATAGPNRVRVRAPVVVLAGGAIGTPALLLASGLGGDRAGRGVFLHPTVAVLGIYDHPIEPWAGPPQTAYSDEFAEADGGRGFWLAVAPAHPGLAGLALPWTGSAAHKALLARLRHIAAIIALLRDHDEGRVVLGRAGTPAVQYRLGRSARRMLVRAMQEAALVHMAAGAREVRTLQKPEVMIRRYDGWRDRDMKAFFDTIARRGVVEHMVSLFSAHLMGGAAMGGSVRHHVTSPEGRVYGTRGLYVADGSAFPGPLGANPMLTIMALAYRTAQHMKARGPR